MDFVVATVSYPTGYIDEGLILDTTHPAFSQKIADSGITKIIIKDFVTEGGNPVSTPGLVGNLGIELQTVDFVNDSFRDELGLLDRTEYTVPLSALRPGSQILSNQCFGTGRPIDMWPIDPMLKPGPGGEYPQLIVDLASFHHR